MATTENQPLRKLSDAEVVLRASERRCETLLQLAPVAIVQADIQGRTLYVNQRWCEITGWTDRDAIGWGWIKTLHPDDRDRVVEQWKQAVGEQQPFQSEHRRLRPGGQVIWILDHAVPQRSASGEVVGFVKSLIDITHRKQTEASLEETNRTLQTLIKASPLAIITLDVQRGVTMWNPASEKIFGFTEQEVLGRPLPIIPDEYREEFQAVFAAGLQGRAIAGVEVRRRRKDGSQIDVNLWTAPLRNATGIATGTMGIIADITERKRAQDALHESEQRFRNLADTAPALIWTVDANRGADYFNQGWLDFTGRTLEQELGDGWSHGIHPEDYDGCLSAFHRAFDARDPFAIEYRLRRHDGQYRWILASGSPRFLPDGIFIGYIGLNVDITARVKAQEALQQSEQRYRRLVDYAPDAIFVIRGVNFVYINDAGLKLLGGTSREQILGRSLLDFIPPNSRDLVRKRLSQVTEESRVIPVSQKEIIRLDGQVVDVEVAATPCIHDGRSAAQFMLRDISDRKRAEEEARHHLAELAHVTRLSSLGHLVSELAHEINQPLYAISNFAEACINVLPAVAENGASEELHRWLRQISEQAMRVGQIVRRLGRYARKAPPRQAPVDVNDMVEDVVRLLDMDIRLREAEIVLELAPSLPTVRADRILIEQVVLNLLLNAADAMQELLPEQRRIVVTTYLTPDQTVQISICDQGHGIAPEHFDRLFEPYFTTKPEGMGMGLPISHSIIEAHRGRLWATPNPHRGVTFSFTLPTEEELENCDEPTNDIRS